MHKTTMGALLVSAGMGCALTGCAGLDATHDAEAMAPRAPLVAHETTLASGAPVEGRPAEGYEGEFSRAGRFVIGPQPSEADLRLARAQGIGTVINLRSTKEMNDPERVGYDEAALARELGMDYVFIPLGGDDGYEPADVDAFDAVLRASKGEALVHCSSGGRARSMLSAWAITRRGWTEEQAEAWRRTAGEKPGSIERLLGKDQTPEEES